MGAEGLSKVAAKVPDMSLLRYLDLRSAFLVCCLSAASTDLILTHTHTHTGNKIDDDVGATGLAALLGKCSQHVEWLELGSECHARVAKPCCALGGTLTLPLPLLLNRQPAWRQRRHATFRRLARLHGAASLGPEW